MSKFHINKYGLPVICKAKHNNCPLGNNQEHFSSQEEAQAFIDNKNQTEFGLLTNINYSNQLSELNDKLKNTFN